MGDYEEDSEVREYTPEELRKLAEQAWEAERQRQTFMRGHRELPTLDEVVEGLQRMWGTGNGEAAR